MKIEIDLNDIFSDEDGCTESLQDSIKRQVTESLIKKMGSGLSQTINKEVSEKIRELLISTLESKTPELIENLLDAEYIQVDRYGDRQKEPTTFRKELVKSICSNMEYKNNSYGCERNIFTKAVDAVVETSIIKFKSQFNDLVNEKFTKEALAYAELRLKERLGIKN